MKKICEQNDTATTLNLDLKVKWGNNPVITVLNRALLRGMSSVIDLI